jgi:hypothetical protein
VKALRAGSMELRSNEQRLPPPWISPAAGSPDRRLPKVIYTSRRRAPTLWTPTQTATELWLTPYDTATTTIATGVSQIRDKKLGLERVFDQATGGAQPTMGNPLNGKNGLTFNGSQWLTSSSSAATWNFLHTAAGAGATIVAVWRAGNTADPNALYGLLGNNAGASANHGFSVFFDDRAPVGRNLRAGALITRGVGSQDAAVNLSGDNAHPANTPVIITHIGDPSNATPANRSIITVNGGAEIKNNSLTNAPSSANASFLLDLGTLGNGASRLVGVIWEIVILPPGTSLATVQLVQGYLAGPVAGWNLQSLLPVGHPYKSAAPTG